MAIKRGPKQTNVTQVPLELAELAESAFFAQQMKDCFGSLFDEDKAKIFKFLEHTDEVTLDSNNKTLDVPECGSITFATRRKTTIDKDKLVEMVESGRINIHTLVEIATFSADKLKTVLGSEAKKVVTEEEPTEYLTLKATPDFKAKVQSEFDSTFHRETKSEPKPPKKAPKKEPKAKPKSSPKDSLAAIKAAKSEGNPDSDLADILGD